MCGTNVGDKKRDKICSAFKKHLFLINCLFLMYTFWFICVFVRLNQYSVQSSIIQLKFFPILSKIKVKCSSIFSLQFLYLNACYFYLKYCDCTFHHDIVKIWKIIPPIWISINFIYNSPQKADIIFHTGVRLADC